MWLDGGPGHLDLYDLKPEAPAEFRGIWHPIKTNVPGIEITELFPLQARSADKFSIIRSLHHDNGDHFTAAHYMLTGRGGPNGSNTAGKYPSVGSLASSVCGGSQAGHSSLHQCSVRIERGTSPGILWWQLSRSSNQSV